MADQIITERPIKQQSGFNLNSYLLGLDADSYRILISDLAKKIVEDYSGSTLAGSAQAVKTALDSIDSTIGNTAMGTTATTITGAIAEHERDISGLNSNFPQAGYGAIADATATEKSVQITFPRAFSSAPRVVVSLYNSSYNRRLHVTSITATGFIVVGALLSGSSSAAIEFEWIAIMP